MVLGCTHRYEKYCEFEPMKILAKRIVIVSASIWLAACNQAEQPICHALETTHYSCTTFDEPREILLTVLKEDRQVPLLAEGDCKPLAPPSALELPGYEQPESASYVSRVSYRLKRKFGALQAYDIRLEPGSDDFEYFNCAHIASISAYGYSGSLTPELKSVRFVEKSKVSFKRALCDDETCEDVD